MGGAARGHSVCWATGVGGGVVDHGWRACTRRNRGLVLVAISWEACGGRGLWPVFLWWWSRGVGVRCVPGCEASSPTFILGVGFVVGCDVNCRRRSLGGLTRYGFFKVRWARNPHPKVSRPSLIFLLFQSWGLLVQGCPMALRF